MKLSIFILFVLVSITSLSGQSKCPKPGLPKNRPLEITFKPNVLYPPEVQASVQGTVTLRVEFLATGRIGRVNVIKGLPYGLTEVAIKAARGLKFKPEIKECKQVDISRPIAFSFSRY